MIRLSVFELIHAHRASRCIHAWAQLFALGFKAWQCREGEAARDYMLEIGVHFLWDGADDLWWIIPCEPMLPRGTGELVQLRAP